MDTAKLPGTAIAPLVDHSGQPIDQSVLAESIDCRAERALIWKFDLRFCPYWLSCTYSTAWTSPIGKRQNGRAARYVYVCAVYGCDLGISKTLIDTLNLHGNQSNTTLSSFFIPYVLTAPFLGILGKIYGPDLVLPCMMLTF